MSTYIIRRLLQALLVMGVMSGLVFVGLYVIGDPVSMMASPEATELDRDAIRANFGLDKPLLQQYAIFMGHALQFDFGKSFLTGQPAMGLAAGSAFPAAQGGEQAVLAVRVAALVAGPDPGARRSRGCVRGEGGGQ